ncbi:hypothetical protein ACFWBR_35085 [Streptomyces sp. NPDC060006]|uniref:hypothetical protein n=1 Tax=unclassified Streptomyces TaxID=2593676 RepID=UPI0036987506
MAMHPAHATRQAGQDWLLSCAERPTAIQAAWDADDLARFETGLSWRVAEASLTLSMDIAKWMICPDRLGPILVDVEESLAWWLLPLDLGDELDDVRQITVRPAGWELWCPPVLYPVRGRMWMGGLDGSGRLTDPVLLGAALGPGGGPRLPAEAFG